ncbi:hypothetical protein BJ508DRAFT_327098 [Ascobolus immersus RN42]|uniref:SSCRP protein n=1 Tax=Ascobolus immersus RN42 TaxID=1160509 RepID=A0A3N4I7Z7_ASCIM|nr:hypothetical protein BJ508DRAFT_327098 [Ascobolus immersus RN42]
MKFATALFSALMVAGSALAHPAEIHERDAPQIVNLKFHAGPAEYSLTIPADGEKHYTNSDLAVDIIDTPDFNAYSQCTFYTAGEKVLAQSINTQTGLQSLVVGPPQPIIAVSCTGTCIYTYGDCYRNGQFLGTCCAGYCAANKCRPWIAPGSN